MIGTAVIAAAFGLSAAILLPAAHAQRGAANAPPPKPIVPVAASTLAETPDPFIGEQVTLVGAVEQILSPTAFLLDQDKTRSTPRSVLVLAPTLNSPVELNGYITAIGEVARFDPDDLAQRLRDYTLDLPADAIARYRGRPVVLATTVLNAALVDLARRLPPPMTPAEEQFSTVMKRVGPAFAALRKGVEASDAAIAREQATVLESAFRETGAYWKARGAADAIGWSEDARKQAAAIGRGAAAGRWEEVKAAASELGSACQSCHGQYRERFDDGSYRIRGEKRPDGRITR
jgi:cytochrome c556